MKEKKYKIALNQELLKSQKVTKKQKKKIIKQHKILAQLLKDAPGYPEKHKPAVVEAISAIEFKLQKHWNFPLDSNFHIYQWNLKDCTCPYHDNIERLGGETKIYTIGCPYHYPEDQPYKGILTEEGEDSCTYSDNTKSIDVSIREDDQSIKVKLPSEHILTIEPNGLITIHNKHKQLINEIEVI